MKIGILIITIILTFTSLHAFRFKWPYALLGNNPAQPRFMQITKNENSYIKNKQNIPIKYSMKISIIKETDTLEDTPITFDTKCELTKESIKLYENKNKRNEISYLE